MPQIHQLPAEALQGGATEGALSLGLALLDEVTATLPRLYSGSDKEALHDFRVGVRRLRACLRAYKTLLVKEKIRPLAKRLQNLASQTGEARDAEVQLEWALAPARNWQRGDTPGVGLVRKRLERQMLDGYRTSKDIVDRDYHSIEKEIRAHLTSIKVVAEPGFPEYLALLIHKHGRTLQSRLLDASGLADEHLLHKARISAKRLRYLIEPLVSEVPFTGKVVEPLKVLQDLLGDLHDLHVLGRAIEDARAELDHDRKDRLTDLSSGPLAPRHESPAELDGLISMAREIRRGQDELLAALRRNWLGGAADDFFLSVKELSTVVAGIVPELI